MRIPDANVLLYATDQKAPHHEACRQWLEHALAGTETVGFPWVALLAFLRISTNPRVYVNPLTPEQATATVSAWLARPAAFVLEPGERHLDLLAGLLRIAGTGGNLVTDAHLAALALEHHAEIVTHDADFRRFTGVRSSTPALPISPVEGSDS